MRFKLSIDRNLTAKEIEKIVLADGNTIRYLGENKIKKIIVVVNKIINIVY